MFTIHICTYNGSMKKLTILAASIALTAASIIPAFAQVPTSATTSKAAARQVKVMPAKARASYHATTKKTRKVVGKKAAKKVVVRKVSKKLHTKRAPSTNATSTIR